MKPNKSRYDLLNSKMSEWEDFLNKSRQIISSGTCEKLFDDNYYVFDVIKVRRCYTFVVFLRVCHLKKLLKIENSCPESSATNIKIYYKNSNINKYTTFCP